MSTLYRDISKTFQELRAITTVNLLIVLIISLAEFVRKNPSTINTGPFAARLYHFSLKICEFAAFFVPMYVFLKNERSNPGVFITYGVVIGLIAYLLQLNISVLTNEPALPVFTTYDLCPVPADITFSNSKFTAIRYYIGDTLWCSASSCIFVALLSFLKRVL